MMHCNVGTNPIKPSLWWEDFLAQSTVLNSKQCQGCADLRTKIRSIVSRKKDKPEEKKQKNKMKKDFVEDLANHRYISHSFCLFVFVF
jgi:hypothetical protein